MNKPAEKPPLFLVQNMEFLVVGIKGEVPPGSRVEVLTADQARPLPIGAVDLNIRNAPAPILRNNFTPLPKTGESIVVKSWIIDAGGKVVPAPEYTVRAVHGGKYLQSINVKPTAAFFRDKPNDPVATVELIVR